MSGVANGETSPVDRARSMSRATAFSLSALVMLVPANLLPVMHMVALGHTSSSPSILRGIQLLFEDGLWVLGLIVFTASVLVPVLKIVGIARLLWAARYGVRDRAQASRLTRLYAALDFIGRWSMLDVFLVAFLSGAVRFGRLALVEPRLGIVAFAAAVVFTMLATHSFDSRLLWAELPSRSLHGHKSPA